MLSHIPKYKRSFGTSEELFIALQTSTTLGFCSARSAYSVQNAFTTSNFIEKN
jgi:hypothetical protein